MKYKCINYNSVLDQCDIHIKDCEGCRLYQPIVVDIEELSEEITRSNGSMGDWEEYDETGNIEYEIEKHREEKKETDNGRNSTR